MELMQLVRSLERSASGSEYLDALVQSIFRLEKPIPPYTRSIDAAMLLIPAGWALHRLRYETATDRGSETPRSSRWAAEMYREGDAFLTIPTHVFAATAPLAICASSFLARAGMTSEDREFMRVIDAARAEAAEVDVELLVRRAV